MYQVSPMNWMMFMFHLIFIVFYMMFYMKNEKMSFSLKYYKKIYVK